MTEENKPLTQADTSIKIEEPEVKQERIEGLNFCSQIFVAIAYVMIVCTFPLSIFFTLKIVREYERAVIFRMGRMLSGGAQGPGLFFVIPCIDDAITVDMRTETTDVAPQEILTKDSVTVTVDAVVYMRVFDPVMSVTKVEFPKYSTMLLASTTLRNTLATKTLHDILRDRDSIARTLKVCFCYS
jgi:erythrocyte band 7 integral membrane protein